MDGETFVGSDVLNFSFSGYSTQALLEVCSPTFTLFPPFHYFPGSGDGPNLAPISVVVVVVLVHVVLVMMVVLFIRCRKKG